jgi:adenylate kinase
MLGAPGSGKGTMAGILSEKFNIPQISTGDIFRENIAEKTELGKLAQEYLDKGALVPDEVTIKLIEDRLSKDDAQNGAILDGFPRTVAQAEALSKLLSKSDKKVDITINITAKEEEIIKRVVNRRICENKNCRAIYNVISNPPKVEGICDKCGTKLVTRKDDNEETVKSRLKTYIEQTSPLVEYYKTQDVLYHVDAISSIEELKTKVVKDICNYLNFED